MCWLTYLAHRWQASWIARHSSPLCADSPCPIDDSPFGQPGTRQVLADTSLCWLTLYNRWLSSWTTRYSSGVGWHLSVLTYLPQLVTVQQDNQVLVRCWLIPLCAVSPFPIDVIPLEQSGTSQVLADTSLCWLTLPNRWKASWIARYSSGVGWRLSSLTASHTMDTVLSSSVLNLWASHVSSNEFTSSSTSTPTWPCRHHVQH